MWTLRAAKGQQDERGNARALAAVHAGPTCSLHFPSRALRALPGATGAVQHGAMEQTGSDFCPKASVSHRLGCQLGTMSRRQSRCAVTKRNRYHFKHTALERGGRGRQENPIMHFYGGERGTGGLTLLWPHKRGTIRGCSKSSSQCITRLGGQVDIPERTWFSSLLFTFG